MKDRLLLKVRDWLWGHSCPYFDIKDYMERRWVFVCPWFSARVHHILRSDKDRHLHDHPFNYATFILSGGYYEILQDGSRTWYGPGSFRRARATTLHRLELPEGTTTWSLFIMGAREREWGFQTEQRWVHWEEYLKEQ